MLAVAVEDLPVPERVGAQAAADLDDHGTVLAGDEDDLLPRRDHRPTLPIMIPPSTKTDVAVM